MVKDRAMSMREIDYIQNSTVARDMVDRARKEVIDYFFYKAGIVMLMRCSTIDECISRLPGWYDKLREWNLYHPQ